MHLIWLCLVSCVGFFPRVSAGRAFGPYDITGEDKKRTQITFVTSAELGRLKQCPESRNYQSDFSFYIQRDNSASASTIKYWNVEKNRMETFIFNIGSTDHTHVTFDGKNLLCTTAKKYARTCNKLSPGVPTAAIILSIDFNPRSGRAHGNQWRRNKYSIQGSYSRPNCQSGGASAAYSNNAAPSNNANGCKRYNIQDESTKDTKITFVTSQELESLKNCPKSQQNYETGLSIYAQRDNSASTSTIKYWNLEKNRMETFVYNIGSTDHTNVKYDGKNILCTTAKKYAYSCNKLTPGVPTKAIIVSVDFKPHRGYAHKNQWSRNKYTIKGCFSKPTCQAGQTGQPEHHLLSVPYGGQQLTGNTGYAIGGQQLTGNTGYAIGGMTVNVGGPGAGAGGLGWTVTGQLGGGQHVKVNGGHSVQGQHQVTYYSGNVPGGQQLTVNPGYTGWGQQVTLTSGYGAGDENVLEELHMERNDGKVSEEQVEEDNRREQLSRKEILADEPERDSTGNDSEFFFEELGQENRNV